MKDINIITVEIFHVVVSRPSSLGVLTPFWRNTSYIHKYLLPFSRKSFSSQTIFSPSAKAFQFDGIPLVYVYFFFLLSEFPNIS